MVIRIPVVFVHRARVEKRTEVDRVDPQIGEVTKLVDYTLKVAAVTPLEHTVFVEVGTELLFPVVARIPITSPRRDLPIRTGDDRRLKRVASRIILRIAIAKPFRKNLVEDSFLRPGWCICSSGFRASREGSETKNECENCRKIKTLHGIKTMADSVAQRRARQIYLRAFPNLEVKLEDDSTRTTR